MKIGTKNLIFLAFSLLLAVTLILGVKFLVAPEKVKAESGEEVASQIKIAHDNCFGEDHERGATAIGADYFTDNGYTLYSGSYFLTENIDLSETVTIEGEVMLCLNGFTLNGNGSDTVIDISADAALILYDCDNSGNGEGKITGGVGKDYTSTQNRTGGGVTAFGGSFIMNGGNITGNSSVSGGGVYIYEGTFEMNGGAITENTARTGGGVYAYYAEFTMKDGSISGNSTTSHGGGVYFIGETSTFIMEGGTISDNASKSRGGGVSTLFGVFIMKGGTVSGNSAERYGGGVSIVAGTIKLQDGEISNNTAKYCGGVHFYGDPNHGYAFEMNGGAITGNTAAEISGGVWMQNYVDAHISGHSVISGNSLSDGTRSNLKLYREQIINVGKLDEGAEIGITPYNTNTGAFTSGGGEYRNNFFSDDDSICVWSIDGDLWIKGHAFTDTPDCDGEGLKKPTCTEKGVGRYYCKSGCGYFVDKVIVPALGHDFETEWNLDADGHWHKCSRCEETTAKADHNWDEGAITKQPTATEDGEKQFTCGDCGQTKKETIPATGEEQTPPAGGEDDNGGGGADKPVDPDDNNGSGSTDTPVGPDDGNGGGSIDTPVGPDISGGEENKPSANSDSNEFPWFVFVIVGIILIIIVIIIIGVRRKGDGGGDFDDDF